MAQQDQVLAFLSSLKNILCPSLTKFLFLKHTPFFSRSLYKLFCVCEMLFPQLVIAHFSNVTLNTTSLEKFPRTIYSEAIPPQHPFHQSHFLFLCIHSPQLQLWQHFLLLLLLTLCLSPQVGCTCHKAGAISVLLTTPTSGCLAYCRDRVNLRGLLRESSFLCRFG